MYAHIMNNRATLKNRQAQSEAFKYESCSIFVEMNSMWFKPAHFSLLRGLESTLELFLMFKALTKKG